ncbi:hypothetical protein HanIR_Chr09g0444511 [Helianthus annuus]|nr:hypothetical protein HanIR_Chr09g0444511 [Helianthus annuus]
MCRHVPVGVNCPKGPTSECIISCRLAGHEPSFSSMNANVPFPCSRPFLPSR